MGFRGTFEGDPIRNFKYQVDIPEGTPAIEAGFSAVRGLKWNVEPVDYREGTEPARPRKLFGQTSFDNVILERGLASSAGILAWIRLITDVTNKGKDLGAEGQATPGDPTRRNVTVILGDYHAQATWEWELEQAWPISWEIGEFTGDGNDVVIETMEMVHEGMNVTSPTGS